MIVNRDCETGVTYDERDAIVDFMTLNWLAVKTRFDVPNGYTRVARAGRYEFYANIYETRRETPRYCVVNPHYCVNASRTNKEV